MLMVDIPRLPSAGVLLDGDRERSRCHLRMFTADAHDRD